MLTQQREGNLHTLGNPGPQVMESGSYIGLELLEQNEGFTLVPVSVKKVAEARHLLVLGK